MGDMQNEMYERLCEMPSEEVLNLLLSYYGSRILNIGFRNYLGANGVMEKSDKYKEAELLSFRIGREPDIETCRRFCQIAGLAEEFEKADGDAHYVSYVVGRAAEILGAEVY